MEPILKTSVILPALLLSACIVEPARLPEVRYSAAPDQPSDRLQLDRARPDNLAQGHLNADKLERQRRRLERIAREYLKLAPDNPHGIRINEVLFEPGDRQQAVLHEVLGSLPIEATPLLMTVVAGWVESMEGRLHELPADFDTRPTIDLVSAEELARIYVSSLPNAEAQGQLVIRFVVGEDGASEPLLAWRIELPGQRVWIDARSGRMLAQERRP